MILMTTFSMRLLDVRGLLNETLPNRWIGRNEPNDLAFCSWPSRSSDLTPFDY